MTHDYKETLYANLFNVLNELSEYESPEVIFDRIVEDFAMSAEYHMGQAETFKSMLDTFRHDNPVDTVLSEPVKPSFEDLYGGVDDINRQFLLEDRDKFMELMKNINFSDSL